MAEKPRGVTHAVYNHNPGNIKGYSSSGKKLDYLKVLDRLGIKYSKGSPGLDGGFFIKFESHQDGYKAAKAWWPAVRNWATYRGLTLDEALQKYSGHGILNAQGVPAVGYSASDLGSDLDGSKLLSEYTDEELGRVMPLQIKREDPKEYEILKNEGLLSEEIQEEEFPGLLPEVKVNEVKYRKEVLDRISGKDEYLTYLEENQDKFKELSNIEKNLESLRKEPKTTQILRTKEHKDLIKRRDALTKELTQKELKLKEQLYKKELSNYVNSENNLRGELGALENEVKGYKKYNEEVPQELINKISNLKEKKLKVQNRVKLLAGTKSQDYDISPVQQGYNQNILLPDGNIDTEQSKTTPLLPNPLGDSEEEDVIYNAVDETPEVVPEVEEFPGLLPEVKVSGVDDDAVVPDQPSRLQQAGNIGESLLKGAGAALDAIGGPGAIISYIMGKKGLEAAMKEIKPQASAQLSPMFMQHLRQTKELAKKGFHPDQEREFRTELDNAYQIGLENAVRGSGGQRARFLAQSGVLDAQRSSALVAYAAKDEELQSKNADKYEKMMLFKENFDLQTTEKERAEDMARQVADKKAAAGFTSAAFSNIITSMGGGSSLGALVDEFMKKRNTREHPGFVSQIPTSNAEETIQAPE
tara:strand:+ start:1135 stop:3060 length:1926 start_codon:yes stop_codon:yes gene_type:complete